jgi:hypothetical protein
MVSRDDIIVRSTGYLKSADEKDGRRAARAVKERRERHKTEAAAPAHPGLK